MPRVDILVLTYLPNLALADAVESTLSSDADVRVLVAINNIPELVAPTIDPLRSRWSGQAVEFVALGRNWGYAEGINRGLEHCSAEYVLLLNDDACLAPGALEILIESLNSADITVVGSVPKILLSDSTTIDAVGTTTSARASATNIGFRETDEGQYDKPAEVGGACFAAVLLRRSAFDKKDVGLLAKSFFMYIEDMDWCIRSRLRGYSFVTTPSAVVYHGHSMSTNTLPPAFKLDLLDRNSWLLAMRCFPTTNAAFVTAARLGRHVSRVVLGPNRRRSWKILADILRLLPETVSARRAIRGSLVGRHPRDGDLFLSSRPLS